MGGTKSDRAERSRRVIKRYSNRKLYDTAGSRYVTLVQIADMVRAGEEVQIIDNASKEDKTEVTLALILSEELRSQPRAVPLHTLSALIREQRRPEPSTGIINENGHSTERAEPGDPDRSAEAAEELVRLRAEVARLAERIKVLEAGIARAERGSENRGNDAH